MRSRHDERTCFTTFYSDSGIELVGLADELMRRDRFYPHMTEMLRSLDLDQSLVEPEEEVFV